MKLAKQERDPETVSTEAEIGASDVLAVTDSAEPINSGQVQHTSAVLPVAAAGARKLLFNSHGGNVRVKNLVARDLRAPGPTGLQRELVLPATAGCAGA